jgi:class 3 adenylate cyclase/tetratricopeptide (TPR) repeat protein
VGAVFCDRCGTRLPTGPVPRFGSPQSYTPKHLAERILTSGATLEGERKQVTVLFADLKGSMELLADRDPEEARMILDPVLEHMVEAVHRFDGFVNQVMGDGIMALFGAPIAHEDHAVRACYAALRMQDSIRRYAEQVRKAHAAVVKIRVGLNSGEVVVRALGSDLRLDYTAVGQTTHLAGRMEQLAEPGTVVLAPATLALAGDYIAVRSLGPIQIKGLQDALEVYELTGSAPTRTRLQATAARRGLTRFVGRDAELEQLSRASARAGEGRGQIAAIVGEAGVGKSRLVYEFSRSPNVRSWLVLESAAVSYGKAASYSPVAALLRRYFKIDERDEIRAIREKVTGKVLALDRSLEPTLPALLTLLDVPVDDTAWQALDAEERRQRTVHGIKALWCREAREQPLLLIVEDLHWLDSETQSVLDDLIGILESARMLLVVNYRPEYRHAWASNPYYAEIRVDALATKSAEQILTALLGADSALDDLKGLLIDRTAGNPFFLEESVRILLETKQLVGEPGAYRIAQPVSTIQIPASVHAVLAARIDRLTAGEKRLLQAAAVIGTDVPFALLREIVELPEPDLLQQLTTLVRGDLLYEARLFPEPEYVFKHVLTHDVTYGTLLQQRRRELHARVVEAIERLHGDRLAEHVERLADHAARGELWEKASRYLSGAAIKASTRSAYAEAQTLFDEALRALGRLPETREVKLQAIDIRLDSRAALAPVGHYARILESMYEAEAVAREVGDRRRLGLVLADIGARLRNIGDHGRATEASQQALDIATELGDAGLQIEAKYRLAQTQFALGDLVQAGTLFLETAKTLSEENASKRASLPRFFPAWPRAWVGLVFAHLGRFPEALAHAEESMRIAESAGHPHTVIEAHGALGGVGLERGDLPGALRAFENAMALLQRRNIGDPNILSGLGYVYALSDRVGDGLSLLEASVGGEASISAMGLGLAVRLSRLAEACLIAGRTEEAAGRARSALDLARKHKERANEALALRTLGEIGARSDPFEAEATRQHYEASLALARQIGMRPLVAHVHWGLGQLYKRTGDREQATEQTEIAATMYRELGMSGWLERLDQTLLRNGA